MQIHQLPPEVESELLTIAQEVPHDQLIDASATLSSRYRDRQGGSLPRSDDVRLLAAYAAARFPATFSAAAAALSRCRDESGLAPTSVVDVGCGIGATSVAALFVWPDVEHLTAVDTDHQALLLHERIVGSLPDRPARIERIAGHLGSTAPTVGAETDLVVSSYALNELPANQVDAALIDLWTLTNDAVAIIEPGTPAGFEVVRRARELLISRGASVAAPCPHDLPCPMTDDPRWCHFRQRVLRTTLHQEAKRGVRSYEDEPYSYVVLRRNTPDERRPRIVTTPHRRKGLVQLEVCDTDGTLREVVMSKREGLRYRAAREVQWGDPAPDGSA